jgi:hypothetical protein
VSRANLAPSQWALPSSPAADGSTLSKIDSKSDGLIAKKVSIFFPTARALFSQANAMKTVAKSTVDEGRLLRNTHSV